MTTLYPGALDSFSIPLGSAVLGTSTPTHRQNHQDFADAVTAIETVLGINPKGSDASVVARLNRMETNITAATPTIQDEGVGLTKRTIIDFVGAGVTVTDDSANSRTLVTIAGGGGGGTTPTIQNQGTNLTQRTVYNFTGAGVTASDNAALTRTDITIPGATGGGGYATVQEEGTSLTQRTTLNFIGQGVTVTDDSANGKTAITIPGGGGGGGGLAPAAALVVSSTMPAAFISAAQTMGGNVYVCDGANDEVQINQALIAAGALASQNPNMPGGTQQIGMVQLTGGIFFIGNSIQMIRATELRGMGRLTELRAVGLSTNTGWPDATVAGSGPAVIKQNATLTGGLPYHTGFTVCNLWVNGNFAAGGTGDGIQFSGPGGGGANSTYPTTGSDPAAHIHNVYVSGLSNSTARNGIHLMNNFRAGHYYDIWVRDCGGNGFWADSSPDSYLSGGDFGSCGTSVRIEGSNWRVATTKSFFANNTGFVFASGRHTVANIESQDDLNGVNISSTRSNFSGISIDTFSNDGLVVSGNSTVINGVTVYMRGAARYATGTNGIRIASAVTDTHVSGMVEKVGGAGLVITNTVVGLGNLGARCYARISDDNVGTITAVG